MQAYLLGPREGGVCRIVHDLHVLARRDLAGNRVQYVLTLATNGRHGLGLRDGLQLGTEHVLLELLELILLLK
jgi:hypothetical protein